MSDGITRKEETDGEHNSVRSGDREDETEDIKGSHLHRQVRMVIERPTSGNKSSGIEPQVSKALIYSMRGHCLLRRVDSLSKVQTRRLICERNVFVYTSVYCKPKKRGTRNGLQCMIRDSKHQHSAEIVCKLKEGKWKSRYPHQGRSQGGFWKIMSIPSSIALNTTNTHI
jgi:hypothetical protein